MVAPKQNMVGESVGPNTADEVAALAVAGMAPKDVGGVPIVLLPYGYTALNLSKEVEAARPLPSRQQGTAILHSADSLLTHMETQVCEATAFVYADIDARTLTAVYDDAKAGKGWRQWRAQFKAELTPEFAKWLKFNENRFSQVEFAEFIEDNIADLPGTIGGTLLKVATTISATTGIQFASARRLHDGQTQLVYNETINATAGDGEITIPPMFTLGLRVFKGDSEFYAINARLKYRLNGGGVTFFYELDRHERALEDAFNGYVEKVRETGYTVLLGKP